MPNSIEWVYPPSWDGTYNNNEDVTIGQVYGYRRMIVKASGDDLSSDVVDATLITRLALLGPNGETCSGLAIDKVEYNVKNFDQLRLYFDGEEDVSVMVPDGSGCLDYTKQGGLVDRNTYDDGDYYTGDFKLTASLPSGASSPGVYELTIHFRPKD